MIACGLTDVGCVRTINQDIFDLVLYEGRKQGIFLVCDGMGGANGGEVASHIACQEIMTHLKAGIQGEMTDQFIKEMLVAAVEMANRAIIDAAHKDVTLVGMGTTLVCAVVHKGAVFLANVGDSRGYFVSNNKIKQITSDHSLVNDLVKAGELTPEEALLHPKRNVITKALGSEINVDCDIFKVEIAENSYLLLCTDGLTNEVSNPELCYEIVNGGSAQNICKSLIAIAKKRGGHDNATVLLASF